MKTGTIQIDVSKDSVTIEGQEVKRPSRLSPSQWYQFWDKLKRKADGNE